MTRRTVVVDADKLEKVRGLILGRVIYSLDLGLPLDDLDAQRIREAYQILQNMRPKEGTAE